MGGTVKGGKRAAQTNVEKYGADFYPRIGAMGGAASGTGGFFNNKDLARKAGALGGTVSRRNGTAKTPRPSPKQLQALRRKLFEEQADMSKQSILSKYGSKRPW